MERMDFSSLRCSIYKDAKDNKGKFVDPQTGEHILEMSIRDFLMTDRWKPIVSNLRSIIDEYLEKSTDRWAAYGRAKEDPRFSETKRQLPCATISALFELRPEETQWGHEYVSRRMSHLAERTGLLVADIDGKDNPSLEVDHIKWFLSTRKEVALAMRSCSGMGLFALVRMAYPDRHGEQFDALRRLYQSAGINIDRACRDITRLRFASYDEDIYVNEWAEPFTGIVPDKDRGGVTLQAARPQMEAKEIVAHVGSRYTDEEKVGILVAKLERHNLSIADSYDEWMRVGFALHNLPGDIGRQYFHRVSALCSSKYNVAQAEKKFSQLGNPQRIGLGTFFQMCKDVGIVLERSDFR